MKAGRELDALIAEKVMGLTRHDESYVVEGVGKVLRFVWRDGGGACVYSGDMFLPQYSTNIADAWEVVEKVGGLDLIKVDAGWMVGEGFGYSNDEGVVDQTLRHHAIAATAPLAICLAALKAKGVTGEQHE